jgi:hypothetical protein
LALDAILPNILVLTIFSQASNKAGFIFYIFFISINFVQGDKL